MCHSYIFGVFGLEFGAGSLGFWIWGLVFGERFGLGYKLGVGPWSWSGVFGLGRLSLGKYNISYCVILPTSLFVPFFPCAV